MAIQSGVDEHIARRCVYTAVISRFLQAACEHNDCIGAQMTMAGQAHAAE